MERVLKQCLMRTIVSLLLTVSIPLTLGISSNIPAVSTIFHHQEAMAQNTATTTPNFLTYHNSTYGINVQYPSDWIYKGSENMSNANNNNMSGQVQPIVTFAPEDENIHALVTIGTVNLPSVFQSIRIENMSSFASLVIDNIRQSTPGFQLVESSTTTVKSGLASASAADGLINNNSAVTTSIPAQKIVHTAAGPVHKTMAVYAIKGDKAFFISYLTETDSIYSSYLPTAQKMIDSFQILNVNTKPSTANITTKTTPNITTAATSNTLAKTITPPATKNNSTISTPQQQLKEGTLLAYANSTYGIKIQFPSDWLYKGSEISNDSVQNIVTFASPNLLTSSSNKSLVLLTVGIERLPFYNIPMDLYTNLTINNLRKSEAGFRLLASNEISLAGIKPAHEIIYTYASGLKTVAVYTIKGDKAFILEYIAGSETMYSSYLPIAQKMIDSFQILNAKAAAASSSNRATINANTGPISSGNAIAVGNTSHKAAIVSQPSAKPSSNTASSLSSPRVSSSSPSSNAVIQKGTAELNAARQQLLLAWNHTGFRDQFDTFVNSADGYGVYQEHKSNIFRPGEPIVLYVEPVGFTHMPIKNGATPDNTKLYLINMTAGIVLSDRQGNILFGRENVPLLSVTSHNKNTELFMNLRVTQSSPFPPRDYIITYTVTDVPSGKSFRIVKDIVIAAGSNNNNSLAAAPPPEAGGRMPLSQADQNNTSPSVQTPCPYALPRQVNGVCPIIP